MLCWLMTMSTMATLSAAPKSGTCFLSKSDETMVWEACFSQFQMKHKFRFLAYQIMESLYGKASRYENNK